MQLFVIGIRLKSMPKIRKNNKEKIGIKATRRSSYLVIIRIIRSYNILVFKKTKSAGGAVLWLTAAAPCAVEQRRIDNFRRWQSLEQLPRHRYAFHPRHGGLKSEFFTLRRVFQILLVTNLLISLLWLGHCSIFCSFFFSNRILQGLLAESGGFGPALGLGAICNRKRPDKWRYGGTPQ